MNRVALVCTCVLASFTSPAVAHAQTTDTTTPEEQRLGPVTQTDNPNVGPALRESPAPVTPENTTPIAKPLSIKDISRDVPTPTLPPAMSKARFLVQHILMGAMTAGVGLAGVVLVLMVPVLMVPATFGPLDEYFPKEWRTATGLVILMGVIPGILLGMFGGVAVTAISAIRNRDTWRE